jgi:hypothetical protein
MMIGYRHVLREERVEIAKEPVFPQPFDKGCVASLCAVLAIRAGNRGIKLIGKCAKSPEVGSRAVLTAISQRCDLAHPVSELPLRDFVVVGS